MIKLPENPTERKKIIALMCIGGLAVLYLAFMFGVKPYMASQQNKKERVTELEDLIWRAQRDLSGVERSMERNAALVKDLLTISEVQRFILRPSLGNYLLVANEILHEAAKDLKLSLDNVSEVPRPAPPATLPATAGQAPKTPASTIRFSPYTVNLSITGGLHALVEFLHRLESSNPYLAATRVVIMQQDGHAPETHFVSVHVQWPTWVDNDHPRRLEAEQIADEERQ